MRRFAALGILVGAVMFGTARESAAQEEHDFLAVGEMAPDVQLDGGTRYGVLSDTVSLSEFRGETVVLAFFFRARTRG